MTEFIIKKEFWSKNQRDFVWYVSWTSYCTSVYLWRFDFLVQLILMKKGLNLTFLFILIICCKTCSFAEIFEAPIVGCVGIERGLYEKLLELLHNRKTEHSLLSFGQ